ncbi:hypothetical protein F889_02613 [Acinetobacter colistiniresistens]|uniref:Phage tail protein n=1 Tax=Acinetobacter colistiniresistens TaxID=280145 RepID=N9PK49_9GAMM|nr:hypothetical protein [Acinetobacter colistiniresistens]ENX33949.1 hypothetical protein F889_02613 [Acinetobacter colistiniresistens]
MKRIDTINARPNVNGTGKAGFHDNSDISGQDATYLSPDWLNHIQEELCNLLEKNGVNVDANFKDQLYHLLATTDDIDALATAVQQKLDALTATVQQKIDAEQSQREIADIATNTRIDNLAKMLWKTLTPATTVYPNYYSTAPINYDAVLISAYFQAGGVLKQTMRVHSQLGDANLHIYLPIAAQVVLHVSTTYQSAGVGTKGDDDSYSRLVDVYEEGAAGAKKTVVVVRTDYVSGSDPISIHRWVWVEVTCIGFTANPNNLDNYPYSRG